MERALSFGQQVFEFIENLDRLGSPGEVINSLHLAVSRFGFEGLVICGLRTEPGQTFNDVVLAAKWPAEFQTVYSERGYLHYDPNVRRAINSSHPFAWSVANYAYGEGTNPAGVLRLLGDFGLSEGYSVPVHDQDGLEVVVGMGGVSVEVPAAAEPGLHLTALCAVERIRQLTLAKSQAAPRLTRREREVLAWSAQGKSAWEIGEILSVTKRTVDEHAQSAMRKLGAANRTQAVAIAIRHRLFGI